MDIHHHTEKLIEQWATSIDSNSYVLVNNVAESIANSLYNGLDSKEIKSMYKTLSYIMEDMPVYDILKKLNDDGVIIFITLGENKYIVGKTFYNNLIKYASDVALNEDRISAESALEKLEKKIILDELGLGLHDIFLLTECVNKYIFDYDEYYVHDYHKDKYAICESCGNARIKDSDNAGGEWYCCAMCEDTESKCIALSDELNPYMLDKESESEYIARCKVQNDNFNKLMKGKRNKGLATQDAINVIASKYMAYIDECNSDLVENTSKNKKNLDSKNISDVTTNTIGSLETGSAWVKSYKAISNPQGHGDMAELLNHQADSLNPLKKAKIVGGSNKKNGADRVVNGQEIQTKYCSTARRSVNAGFKNGKYKYYDKNGKPMQLEVPKDQYDKAVEIMREKIKNGEVPGVTDPNEAENIVIKGKYTRSEAKEACKFFTKTSLKYDSINGVIVATKATGISFAICTALNYYKHRDIKKAIKESAVISLQTGSTTFAVYLLGAQAQKIPAINKFMQEVISCSFNKNSFIGKGLASAAGWQKGSSPIGMNSAANTALRATVVSALAMIAVTSSIEIVQMARRKISAMQCVQNIILNVGGITGSAMGGLTGAMVCTPIPVVGPIVGGLVGSALGNITGRAIASMQIECAKETIKFVGSATNLAIKYTKNTISLIGNATNKIIGNSTDTEKLTEDINKKYRIFYGQMTNLAMLFKLSNDEMSEFSNLVDNIVGDGAKFFGEFSASEMLPYANSVLKPLVVMIVSRRPKLLPSQFNDKYIQEVITQEAEELAKLSG